MLCNMHENRGGTMKTFAAFIFLISVAVYSTGCGGEEEVADTYYPLNAGNSWTYTIGMTVAAPGTTAIYLGSTHDTIIGTTLVTGGISAFTWATSLTLNGYSSRDTFYIHESDTAVYIYESIDDTSPDKYLVLPIESGNAWTVNSGITASVLGFIDVSVPAGDYSDCWQIAYVENNETTLVYLAHNVGEVKGWSQYSVADTTVTIRLDLESATVQ